MKLAAILVVALSLSAVHGQPIIRQVWSGPDVSLLGAPSRDSSFLTAIDPITKTPALFKDSKLTPIPRTLATIPGEFAYFSVPSRDGKRIAYAWFNDKRFYELRVSDAGSGSRPPRVVYQNPEAGFVQPTAWTPDGKSILTLFFRRDNISQIALVDVDTGEAKILRSLNWVYPKKMDLSPDGRWIVFDTFPSAKAGPRDVYLLAVDGTRESKLVEHPADDLFPLFSPDGSEVAFASDRLSAGSLDLYSIPVRDGRPAGPPRLVQRDLGRYLPLGATDSGSIYFGKRARDAELRLGLLPVRSGADNPGKIALLAPRGQENYGLASRALWIRNSSTENLQPLDIKLAHMEKVRWSPDAETLLVSGSDGKGRAGLFLVTPASGAVRAIVIDEQAGAAGLEGVWIDAKRIAYLTANSIREKDLDSGEEKVLAPMSAKAIANGPMGLAVATATEVLVLNSKQRWAVRGIEQLEWKGDDLLVTRGAAAAILNETGARKLDLPGYKGGPLTVSCDGSVIAYPVGSTQEEVWVMENVWPAATHSTDPRR